MPKRRFSMLRPSLIGAGLMLMSLDAGAQSTASLSGRCDDSKRVQSVKFSGSPEFTSVEMATLIVNTAPTFLNRVLQRAHYVCLDTLEVQRDALRLAVLHRSHGWFLASVTPRYETRSNGVRLFFDITAGPEARIDSVVINGLPETAPGVSDFANPILKLRGARLDRPHIQGVLDTVVMALRDAGYARAVHPGNRIVIDTASASESTPASSRIEMDFVPGTQIQIGEVHVTVQGIGSKPRRIDSAGVMRIVGLRAGQRFSARNVTLAQQQLYRSEAFRLVLIDTVAPRLEKSDSVLDLRIAVAEAHTRSSRAGVGWATQDCGRVQARVQNRGFLGPGRRAEISMRASKIGVGEPADFAPALCSGAIRTDFFSQKLNYYGGVSFSDSRFFGYPWSPVLSVYSERRSEPFAYLRETTVGALTEFTSQSWRRSVVVTGLQYEQGRTISDPVVSCTRFGRCQPDDSEAALFGRGVGVWSTSVTHDRTNDAINPRDGSRYRGELRAGLTSSSNTDRIQFYRGTGEASIYKPFARGTIASRVQIARVMAPGAPLVNGSPLIPQQERLFAGGQNSVRGFQQNLLGPVVFVFKDSAKVETVTQDGVQTLQVKDGQNYDLAVPRGGTALVVGNLEWRRRVRWPTDQLQVALFVDAGTVFEARDQKFRWRDVRVTPGIGARLDTPLGPFRVDMGYQPYEQRAGRALLFTGTRENNGAPSGSIRCVSPRNTIAVGNGSTGDLDFAKCPESYRPTGFTGALARLVFHFSIGQAF